MDYDQFCEQEECPMSEFDIKINALIYEEVKSRIGETVKNLEDFKAKYEKCSNDLTQERNELYKFKMQCESDLKKAIAEKEKEFRRELFGGFEVKDVVYFLEGSYEYEKCGKCDATGNVEAEISGEKKKINCPYCNGKGKTSKFINRPKRSIIRSILVQVRSDGGNYFEYYLRGSDCCIKTLYKTEEECQKECDLRNNK